MNWKEAERIKPGAIVRESWMPDSPRTGLVLAKEYEEGEKRESLLCLVKDKRYILTINWFCGEKTPQRIKKHSSWDLMVIKHAK
jgi:hypothetical protein